MGKARCGPGVRVQVRRTASFRHIRSLVGTIAIPDMQRNATWAIHCLPLYIQNDGTSSLYYAHEGF